MAMTSGQVAAGTFAIIFSVLTCALPYWETNDEYNVYGGLWKLCYKITTTEFCGDPLGSAVASFRTYDKPSFKTVRAMVILGVIANVGGLVGLTLGINNKIIVAMFIAAGMFHMIALAIYVDKIADANNDKGAGVAFDIIAWLLSWVAAGLVMWDAIKGDDAKVAANESA